jgi:large subunit ribosomal protein L15
MIRGNGHPTKILGRGQVTVALNISANKFTKSAKEKIEAAGGSVKVLD